MNTKQLPLMVGLGLPVLLVLILAAIIFIPRAYVVPEYDFVYVSGDYPQYYRKATGELVEFRLVEEGLVREVSANDNEGRYAWRVDAPEFFIHDVSENQNRALSEEEVLSLRLDGSTTSPDGFELTHPTSSDNVFEAIFGGRDYDEWVLERGSVTAEVNLISKSRYQFHFIGWVIQ